MSFYKNFSEQELAILRERAARIARVSDDQQREQALVGLTVHLSGEHYILPIDSLMAVYEQSAVTPVPCTPNYVAGVANIRGHVIPVLNLAVLLRIPASNIETGPLVVAMERNTSVAFRVESIGEVVMLTSEDRAPITGTIDSGSSPYVTDHYTGGLALVDVAGIIGDDRLVVDEMAG